MTGGYLRRRDLYPTGGYLSVPDAIASREDLTPAAKLVAAAYGRHLGGAKTDAWPSLPRVAAMCGCSVSAAARGREQLRAAGLIAVEPRCGRSSIVRFLPAAAGGNPPQNDGGQRATTDGNPPQNDGGTPRKMTGHPPQNDGAPPSKCATEVLKEVLKEVRKEEQHPPYPPDGGGAQNEVLRRWADGYAAVYGGSLPRAWRRRIVRELTGGDAETAAAVGPEQIAAAEAARGELSPGVGTVLLITRRRAAERIEAERRAAGRKRHAAARAAEARAAAEAQRTEHIRQREYFDRLSPAERARYARLGAAAPGVGKRADRAAAMAVLYAWRDRPDDEPAGEQERAEG